jgi:hypothetical protein
LKTTKLFLGLVACLAASLTACTTTTTSQTGPAALTAVRSPDRHAHLRAGCPLGRVMSPGRSIAVDYVDFLQFGGRMYIASYPPIKGVVLGRVITHVRCSLVAEENQQRGAAPVIDRTAAFLAAGATVYEVRGYSPSCRLAAYLHGRLQAYLAQTTVHHHIEPLPCALGRTRF